MVCHEVTPCSEDETQSVRLSAVVPDAVEGADDCENAEFWKYTPSGTIEFDTINAEAAEQFEEGAEYYVDITRAD